MEAGKAYKSWECPSCAAMNFVNKDGSIADSIPAEHLYKQSSSSSSAAPAKLASLSSPFCSVCTSNQTLLLQTLANYLPDESDPDIAVYERALPAYKASLEERYPPICSSCAPGIQARLQRNNYIAKSTALGNWLRGAKDSRHTQAHRGTIRKSLLSLISLVRGLLWFAANGLMLYWFVLGSISPVAQLRGVTYRRDFSESKSQLSSKHVTGPTALASPEFIAWYYSLLRRWSLVFLVAAMWHPKQLHLIWGKESRLQGKKDYMRLQLLIQALRFAALFLYPYRWISDQVHMRLSFLCTLLSIIHMIGSFLVLQVVPRARLNLRDKPTSLHNLTTQESELTDNDGRQAATSFHLPKAAEAKQHSAHILDGDSDDEPANDVDEGILDDAMDWQASPVVNGARPSTRSPFADASNGKSATLPRMFPQPIFAQPRERYFSSNPSYKSAFAPNTSQRDLPLKQPGLAPQRFFPPERPTGLENLFSAAVRLDDEPLLVRSFKSVQQTPRVAAWVLLVLALSLVPALYLQYFFTTALLGELILILGCFVGVFKNRQRWIVPVWLVSAFVDFSCSYLEQKLTIRLRQCIYACALVSQLSMHILSFKNLKQASKVRKPRVKQSHFKRA